MNWLSLLRLTRVSVLGWLIAGGLTALVPGTAQARTRVPADPVWGLFGPQAELSEASWVVSGIHQRRPFRLAADPSLGLLARYLSPSQNHVPEWRSFFRGAYGLTSWQARWSLSWALSSAVPEPEPLSVSTRGPCPVWRAPRPVTVARYDGVEQATLPLIDCEGGVAPEAIDVLSVLSRPPGTPRPALPLPPEPAADAGAGEWLPNLRLVEPRLVWALQRLAEAFPGRKLYIMSGYRKDGHSGFHGRGRALDLFVHTVPNEQVFAVCRRLRDVGCGYYPNSKFVHVDVRPYGTDRVLWVDDSEPGRPSHYLDGFPGVLEPGRAWVPG